jgi:hypothetical protein
MTMTSRTESPAARKKSSKFKEWTLAIAISIVCGAVAVEIGLRVAFKEFGRLYEIARPSGDSRSYELRPGSHALYHGFWDVRADPISWTINGDGLRSDREVPPRSGKYRILTYGDSETFGWALSLEDTFQRRIEALDPEVEVLNMGVPGYNIANIADYMEKTIDKYRPDRVIYLSHKNDFDRPLILSPILSKSWLYNAIRFVIVETGSKARKAHRRTPEGYRAFMDQLERVVAISRRRNVPLTIGVLHWEFEKAYEPAASLAWTPGKGEAATPPPFHADVLNFNDIWYTMPRRDHHMGEEAHIEMANRFCKAISAGGPGPCTPPGRRAQ